MFELMEILRQWTIVHRPWCIVGDRCWLVQGSSPSRRQLGADQRWSGHVLTPSSMRENASATMWAMN
jgi:hypothetical protein